jgi:hypothetical protein
MYLLGPVGVGKMGTYMRYVGDDYCYSAALKSGGFLGGQIETFSMVERFNGDRYTLTFVSFLTELFGPEANAVAVGLTVALWLVGLTLAVYQLLRLLKQGRRMGFSFAVASVISFSLLLTYPDRFVALYWVIAMYTYFAPMVAMVWLSVAVLTLLLSQRVAIWKLLALFAATWVFGAFSETGTVLQLAWLVVFSLAVWRLEGREFWSRDYRIFLAPLLATCLALVTMMLSPYGLGFFKSGGVKADIGGLLVQTIRAAAGYVFTLDKGFRTPYAVELITLGAMGYLTQPFWKSEVHRSWGLRALMLLAFLATGWFLVAMAFFPSYLVLKSFPSPRALMPAHILRHLVFASIALYTGRSVGGMFPQRRRIHAGTVVGATLVILAASLYPIRAYPYFLEREAFMKKWSYLWDQRDEEIRAAVKKGQSNVRVMRLDHPVPWLAELGENPRSAYNQCAQEYYGISSIIADLPGWRDFQLP